jgi:hypothetical protein
MELSGATPCTILRQGDWCGILALHDAAQMPGKAGLVF